MVEKCTAHAVIVNTVIEQMYFSSLQRIKALCKHKQDGLKSQQKVTSIKQDA